MIPELRLFGGAALVAANGQPVTGAAAQARRLAVLALLADAWPSSATRDRIIGFIWPNQDEVGARRLLTQALYELRRELGPVIRSSGRDLLLDTEHLRVDLIEFRRALDADDFDAAGALYRGVLLDGFHLRGASEFERWLDEARDDTRHRFERAMQLLAERHEGEGRFREAARCGARVVQSSPYDADVVSRVMGLLERAGDHGSALAIAATYERRMREELELEPAPEVAQRVEAMRTRVQPATTISATTAPVATTAASPQPSAEAPLGDASRPPVQPAADTYVPARPQSHLRPHRVLWLGVAAAAVVLLALAASRLRVERAPVVTPRQLVIVPFAVHGDDEAAQRIAGEVTSMLVASLDDAGGVHVTDAAPRGSAWAELRGQVVLASGRLRLDGELRRMDGSARPVVVTADGPQDSLIALTERLAVGMLPALYPASGESGQGRVTTKFRSAAVLRRFLDGETALRRGEFDSAFAALKSATELDPSQGWLWYRRAIAAERSHRAEDADRSVAAAEARSATLDARERKLVRGYALWRAGDAAAAESIFRSLVQVDSRDREAWFQLAEIAYHAGPLLGRRLDDAGDPWRQVVALDSGDVEALIHALRLAARSRDSTAVAALLNRMSAAGPTSSSIAESRVIAAYAVGERNARAAAQRDLDTLPSWSLGFLDGVVAGLLEQPAAAEEIARRLTRESQPNAVRAEGHLALAHVALARGRWSDASRELDRSATYNPVAAAWTRAYFTALPFLRSPLPVHEHATRTLDAAPALPVSAPLYLQLAVDVPAASSIERYLHGLLQLNDPRSGGEEVMQSATDPMLAMNCLDDAMSSSSRSLCEDLQRGIRTEALWRRGQPDAALATVESLHMKVPYQFAGRSVFFARTRERYLRAELLAHKGRLEEAYAWYAAVPNGSWMDYVYLAPTHLRRGQLAERLGRRETAAGHYRKALELWQEPDSELVPLRRAAAEGLARLEGSR
jgi:DNA-binding SARP family transcriptional activator